ncbi:hypothetical protein J4463_04770 [Candidatus Pacearchaeota archaeon]|nr:hypothetical protein [Candidatus Pacearchaeota archaeon]
MAAVLEVLSDKKGSNPGGECNYNTDRLHFQGYFKYVYGSKIIGDTSFVPKHQPIYEYITFVLAQALRLKTADTFILLNTNRDVEFRDLKKNWHKDHSGRDYYFISRMIPRPKILGTPCENYQIPRNEIVCLDSLLISDIVGKSQNYIINPIPDSGGAECKCEVAYLDLGCSFVHATGGFLLQPNKLKLPEKREIRRFAKDFERFNIIGADNDKLINLEELANSIYDMWITTLNPWGRQRVSNFLSQKELDEIYSHIIVSFHNNISKFEEEGLFICDSKRG